MKLLKSKIKGVEFYHREGFSDLKTFKEVIERNSYQQRGLKIQPGQWWMDCGANVGAFALLACSKGAQVTCYEPDPFNCEMIEKNLKLNGFQAQVIQAALVPDTRTQATLFIGNNGNVWRNSIVKQWNEKGLRVPCLNFDQEAARFQFCKMDIEGAEMPILEATEKVFEKLVYEWSFDIDASLARLWSVIDRQVKVYDVRTAYSTIHYQDRQVTEWQKSWFPACVNVFCHRLEQQ